MIMETIRDLEKLLTERGRLSIIEIVYDAYAIDRLPSKLIFGVTASRILAPLARKLGANSAGCGVCYMSLKQLHDLLAQAGLEIVETRDFDDYRHPAPVKLGLHIRRIRPCLLWVRRIGEE